MAVSILPAISVNTIITYSFGSVKLVKKMASWNKIKVKLFVPNRIHWKELHVSLEAIKAVILETKADTFLRYL